MARPVNPWHFLRAPVAPWRVVVAVAIPFWIYVTLQAVVSGYVWSTVWKGIPDVVVLGPAIRTAQHVILGTLSVPIYILMLRIGWPRRHRIHAIVAHLSLALAFALLGRVVLMAIYGVASLHIAYHDLGYFIYLDGFWDSPILALRAMLNWFMSFWMGFVAILGLMTYIRLRDEKLQRARLQSQWLSARLDALSGQLNPHFLFNSLHTVSAFIHEDPDRAEDLIVRLSDLLRRNLRGKQRAFVSVSEELDAIRLYLEIERTRFEDRLQVEIEAHPDCLRARVPGLILQPLVENAIKHGVSAGSGPGYVRIRLNRMQSSLVLAVTNSMPAAKPAQHRPGTRLGINHTIERLRTVYGEQFAFDSGPSSENEWRARIELPLAWSEDEVESPDGGFLTDARPGS